MYRIKNRHQQLLIQAGKTVNWKYDTDTFLEI